MDLRRVLARPLHRAQRIRKYLWAVFASRGTVGPRHLFCPSRRHWTECEAERKHVTSRTEEGDTSPRGTLTFGRSPSPTQRDRGAESGRPAGRPKKTIGGTGAAGISVEAKLGGAGVLSGYTDSRAENWMRGGGELGEASQNEQPLQCISATGFKHGARGPRSGQLNTSMGK
jgi:hypothetical protein